MTYVGLRYPDTGFPVPDVYIYYVSDVSIFIHISRIFCQRKLILNSGLDNIQCASFICQIDILSLG